MLRKSLIVLLLCAAASAQTELRRSENLPNINLSAADRLALQDAIERELSSNDASDHDYSSDARKANVRAIDLNADGVPEVLAQSSDELSCSPTGNCVFWIFQKKLARFTPLLSAEAQLFKIMTTRNRGYLDIALGRHGSAFESEWRLYKFNGKKYIPMKCWVESYRTEGSDKMLEKPRILPCN